LKLSKLIDILTTIQEHCKDMDVVMYYDSDIRSDVGTVYGTRDEDRDVVVIRQDEGLL